MTPVELDAATREWIAEQRAQLEHARAGDLSHRAMTAYAIALEALRRLEPMGSSNVRPDGGVRVAGPEATTSGLDGGTRSPSLDLDAATREAQQTLDTCHSDARRSLAETVLALVAEVRRRQNTGDCEGVLACADPRDCRLYGHDQYAAVPCREHCCGPVRAERDAARAAVAAAAARERKRMVDAASKAMCETCKDDGAPLIRSVDEDGEIDWMHTDPSENDYVCDATELWEWKYQATIGDQATREATAGTEGGDG